MISPSETSSNAQESWGLIGRAMRGCFLWRGGGASGGWQGVGVYSREPSLVGDFVEGGDLGR